MTPVAGRYLLDTNIIIALLAGDEAVLSHLDRAAEVFIPAVALGELFFGAAKSARPIENAAKVERFAAGRVTIPSDVEVAREYGRVKHFLREKERPLPENDIWIGAAAKRHGFILVIRDHHFVIRDHHFDEIDNLQTADCGLGRASVNSGS